MSSISQPLPLLPTEIKKEVLRFCDLATLATTSLLSFAFLELSSPLLYHDVELAEFHSLEALFCNRDDSHQPQLEPFLDLLPLSIRTLDVSLPSQGPLTNSLSLRTARVTFPLNLDLLVVRIAPRSQEEEEPEEPDEDSKSEWSDFLRLFNPRNVRIIGIFDHPSSLTPLHSFDLPSIDLRWTLWNNLESLTFERSRPFPPLSDVDLARRTEGTEPRPLTVTFEEFRPLTVTFDGSEETKWELMESFSVVVELGTRRALSSNRPPGYMVRECMLDSSWITVVVRCVLWTRDNADGFLSWLEDHWTGTRVSREQQRSRRARLLIDTLLA